MVVGGEHNAPTTLPPREDPDTHGRGGCFGSRAGLDVSEERKFSCIPGFEPRIFQRSYYTDYVINNCITQLYS